MVVLGRLTGGPSFQWLGDPTNPRSLLTLGRLPWMSLTGFGQRSLYTPDRHSLWRKSLQPPRVSMPRRLRLSMASILLR
eukprot:12913924-Prorocentrum_lima.AAC.1